MIDFNFAVFIPIVAMIASAWIITKVLHYRHLKRETGVKTGSHHDKLAGENDQLRSQVSQLQDRLAVLERIATDPAERTAREIESLR
jgi:hypothetical protein